MSPLRTVASWLGAGTAAAVALTAATPSRPADTKLYGVIAGYFVAFAHHVRWPAPAGGEAAGPLRIGVLGRDPFGPELDRALAGRTVGGRPFAVVRATEPAALAECHIVFADRPTEELVTALETALAGRPVLTVLFSPETPTTAGIVDLVVQEDGTLRYKLAVNRLVAAGLSPSPELLKLALGEHPRP